MSLNYIGSKATLIPFIRETIYKTVGPDLSQKVFADLFAGTGIVARSFNDECKRVIANDTEYYSYVLLKHYLYRYIRDDLYQEFIDYLNNVDTTNYPNGFIFTHYCTGGGWGRNYFTNQNGLKIDAIRMRLNRMKNSDEPYYYYAGLASLLEAADKVANTASTYVSHLKHIKKTAQKPIWLETLKVSGKTVNQVYNKDANSLVQNIEGDILYLDPPYNTRQYGAYYHVLETIARYDDFIPKGVTGQRNYYRSKYCEKKDAERALDALLNNARFKYIFLSYNNEGIIPIDTIRKILSKYGKYDVVSTPHKRFKQDATCVKRPDNTLEYIHILEKK